MNDKEVLELVKKEIIKYQNELKQNIFDEVIGSSVYYASTFASAYLFSSLVDESRFNELWYAIAFLISSILSLKNHKMYARSENEKNSLKQLKQIKRNIIMGINPFENISKDEFKDYVIKLHRNTW